MQLESGRSLKPTLRRTTRYVWWAAVVALLAAPLSITAVHSPALAQFWQWPWENEQPRRRQRPPAAPQPQYDNQRGQGYGNSQGYRAGPDGRPAICLQLEQRLAQEANRGAQSRGRLPQIEQAIRDARRALRRAERQLDRRGCYEQFLFTRSLRRTRRCVALDRDARTASRQVESLTLQRQQILGGGGRSFQQDIIRELAYNNCGGVYQQEARRRSNPFSNFWQDEDSGDRGFRGNTFAGLPFATYRTVCVRLCDGYYFPVSFSTLPTYFSRDADVCQSRCAAPTALYFHQNPGQAVDQMVSHRSQIPYAELDTAFRYRKEYVRGCSCKQAEYIPEGGNGALPRKASAAPPVRSGQDNSRGGLSPVR